MRRFLQSITTPTRVAIAGSLIVAVINLVFLGATFQRRNAVATLRENIASLEENIQVLQEVDQERVQTLQEELDAAKEDLEQLRNAFPELGAPFAMYDQGMTIATQNQLTLNNIALQSEEKIESPTGPLQAKTFSLNLEGTLGQCIRFIRDVEQAGQQTLVIENISISPGNNSCSLDIRAFGLQP